jgi:hypothetical protein
MGEISKREDDWQAKATATAIAEARKIATGSAPLMNTPVGRLTDLQWGCIIAGALFGWITTRHQQAIAESWDPEEAVTDGGFTPCPTDVAAVRSILPKLANQAGIDWSQPLSSWSKDTMSDFILLAWQLVSRADCEREYGPGVLRKTKVRIEGGIPF